MSVPGLETKRLQRDRAGGVVSSSQARMGTVCTQTTERIVSKKAPGFGLETLAAPVPEELGNEDDDSASINPSKMPFSMGSTTAATLNAWPREGDASRTRLIERSAVGAPAPMEQGCTRGPFFRLHVCESTFSVGFGELGPLPTPPNPPPKPYSHLSGPVRYCLRMKGSDIGKEHFDRYLNIVAYHRHGCAADVSTGLPTHKPWLVSLHITA